MYEFDKEIKRTEREKLKRQENGEILIVVSLAFKSEASVRLRGRETGDTRDRTPT